MADRIGFVGLGKMGVPMTANIVAKGGKLTVHDIDIEKAKTHAAKIGAAAAPHLAALGEASDVVVTMLPTGETVRQVVLEQGLAEALAPGTLVIDMSSSAPEGSVKLAAALAKMGIGFVDAPVSGTVPQAEAGTLTIMAGTLGDASFAKAEPLLKMVGKTIFRTGAIGTGHAMKALTGFVAAAGFAAGSEAMIMGERFGLDPETALKVMQVSMGRNFSTERTLPNEVLTRRFQSGLSLAFLAKDVGIAAGIAESLGGDLPLVAATDLWWQTALDDLGGSEDHTAAYLAWEERAKG